MKGTLAGIFLLGFVVIGYATGLSYGMYGAATMTWLLGWCAAGCLANGTMFLILATRPNEVAS